MTGLLDVNVLLALAWPNHQFHGRARAWFGANAHEGFWTCNLTQLAFVRLSSNPAYTPYARSPLEATLLLQSITRHPSHRFLETTPSCANDAYATLAARLEGHRQTTDAYLVLLAQHHGLRLVTFDRRIAAYAPEDALVLVEA